MSLAFFITALLVVLLLRRQAAVHRVELKRAYARQGRPVPPLKPKVSTLEAGLTVAVGVPLIIFGAWDFYSVVRLPEIPAPDEAAFFPSILLGVGLSLVVVGVRVIRELRKYRSRGGSVKV
jgi:hypothetical protein